jgi:hypothetical protein
VDHESVTIEWACAFCGGSISDDPRATEVGVAFLPGGASQYFRTHFECLRAALHTDAAAELVDPLEESR